MERFKQLVSLCKASVEISVNNHRDYYQSVKSYIEDANSANDLFDDLDLKVYDEMIRRNTIVEIQAYPDTPIGFYKVYHYDIDIAMDEIIEAIKNKK